jgi:hypothetical protein
LGTSGLGFAVTIFTFVLIYVTKVVVFYPLAYSLLEKSLPSWNASWVVPLIIGTLAFVLLSSIPWLGTLLSVATTFTGLGAIWMATRDRFTTSQTPAPKLVLTPA